MATSPCEDVQGESLLDMEFPVEEDVDACLAHFVFLSRLGLPNAIGAAQELADKVLWRHWSFFPVFAELGAFFVSTGNRQAATELVLDCATTRYNFEEDSQLELVQILALFSRARLAMATTEATCTLFGDTKASSAWLNPLLGILQSVDYQSTAKLHIIEMCLWSLLDAKISDESQRPLNSFINSHLDTLIDRGLFHEATEVLYLACVLTNNHRTVLVDFKVETYLYLCDNIEVNFSKASTTDDTKDNILTKLRLRSALLVASRSQNEKAFTSDLSQIDHLKTLDHDIDQLSFDLCSMLDIGADSESSVACLTHKWSLRPKMELTNESTALAKTSMGVRSPNNAAQDKIQILDVAGHLSIMQARGQLFVDSYHGEIHLQNPYGEIYSQQSHGEIHLQNSHGELYVQSSVCEAFINASEGDIDMQDHNGKVHLARCRGHVDMDFHDGGIWLQQPKGRVMVHQPTMKMNVVLPQGPIIIDRPATTTKIRLAQGPIFLDRPAMEAHLRCPQGPTFVNRPIMETNVHLAEGPIFLNRPSNDTHVKQSKGRVHIDCPESGTYIKSPRQVVHLESPESKVTVAKALRNIEIFKCNGKLQVYEPEGDVRINSASGEVHVHEPAQKVEIVRPGEVVHIYEPSKDIHIYSLNGKKIFVHGGSYGENKAEVIGAEEEPCPSYSTEYEMPVFPETPYEGQQPAVDLEAALENAEALMVDEWYDPREKPPQALIVPDRKSAPGPEKEQLQRPNLELSHDKRPLLPYYATEVSLAPIGTREEDIKIGVNAVARVSRLPTAVS